PLALALIDFQRLLAILGQEHAVAVPLQDGLAQVADHGLVIDEQDGLAAAVLGGRRCRLAHRRGPFLEAWQVDVEARAAVDLARAIDPALMLLDDAEDQRQAENGALARALGGEERLEDALAYVRGDAVAGVGDAEQHEIAGPGVEVKLDVLAVDDDVGR